MSSKGFTLLEILITIGLIALVSAIAIPSLTFILKTSPEAFARQLSGLCKEAKDRALLSGNIVRLHIDLDKQNYWLEEAPPNVMIAKITDEDTRKKNDSDDKDKDKDKEKENPFRQVTELTKEKKDMPSGLQIIEVLTPRTKNPIKEGDASIYFFPHGGADQAILHIQDEDGQKESVSIHPVTGFAKFDSGFLTVEESQ